MLYYSLIFKIFKPTNLLWGANKNSHEAANWKPVKILKPIKLGL